MRYFVMGELMGGSNGMECESGRYCTNRSWTIVLTDEESKNLPMLTMPNFSNPDIHAQARFILENKLGVVTCKECRK